MEVIYSTMLNIASSFKDNKEDADAVITVRDTGAHAGLGESRVRVLPKLESNQGAAVRIHSTVKKLGECLEGCMQKTADAKKLVASIMKMMVAQEGGRGGLLEKLTVALRGYEPLGEFYAWTGWAQDKGKDLLRLWLWGSVKKDGTGPIGLVHFVLSTSMFVWTILGLLGVDLGYYGMLWGGEWSYWLLLGAVILTGPLAQSAESKHAYTGTVAVHLLVHLLPVFMPSMTHYFLNGISGDRLFGNMLPMVGSTLISGTNATPMEMLFGNNARFEHRN
jgi:hypothetical protein